MNYSEALALTVTNAQAEKEIAAHGLSFEDFTIECGNKEEYLGKTILDWLGY